MLPYLRQVDLVVWLFYISKGFLGAKIRDNLDKAFQKMDKIIKEFKFTSFERFISKSNLDS